MRNIFMIPIIVYIISVMTMHAYNSKGNSEETSYITPSNYCTNIDTEIDIPEGIINVETSFNYDVFTSETPAIALDNKESELIYEPEPIPIATPEPKIENMEEYDAKTDSNNYSGGIVKTVPKGRGSKHTFMGWQLITNKSSKQYKLRVQSGEHYDSNGFARIGDRFVVAVKPYYGSIGDYIDVYKSNGEIIKCIIGDAKGSDGGGDKYGHSDGSIVEFVVDKYKWYSKYNNLGKYRRVDEFYPSWTKHNISKIVNVGNYWS